MPPLTAVRTYLELRDSSHLRAARQPEEPVTLVRASNLSAAEYLRLYTLVGDRWLWRDRLLWSESELSDYLVSTSVHVHVLHSGSATSEIAGYFELKSHDDGRVEIMYFGLQRRFIGRGLGKWLLTRACEEAFAIGGTRVVLNTCTLDAPQALPNYLARGFTIVREETYVVQGD